MQAALLWYVVRRAYAVPYEWGRVLRLAIAAAAIFGLGQLPALSSTPVRLGLIVMFPLLLLALGFLDASEKRHLRRILLRG